MVGAFIFKNQVSKISDHYLEPEGSSKALIFFYKFINFKIVLETFQNWVQIPSFLFFKTFATKFVLNKQIIWNQ